MPRDDDPADVREDVLRRVRTEGLEAAYEGAIEVLRNPRAQASAKATCAMLMFRANNLLNAAAVEDPSSKPAYEMTYDELQREVARIMRINDQVAKLRPSAFD